MSDTIARIVLFVFLICLLIALPICAQNRNINNEQEQVLITSYSTEDVLKTIRNNSAAAVFGRGLFEYPYRNPKTIHLSKLLEKGTGWIELFERKSQNMQRLVNAQNKLAFVNWLDEKDIHIQIDELITLLDGDITKYKKESRLRLEYCDPKKNKTDIPINEAGERIVLCGRDTPTGRFIKLRQELVAEKLSIDAVTLSSCSQVFTQKDISDHCVLLREAFFYWYFKNSEENSFSSDFFDPNEAFGSYDIFGRLFGAFDTFDKAAESCEDESSYYDDFLEEPCWYFLLANDYNNELKQDRRFSLSLQRENATPSVLSKTQKTILETKLNMVLEQIRNGLQIKVNSLSDSEYRPLPSAKVQIAGSGYEIVADQSSMSVKISETILRDIYIRAFQRASVFFNFYMAEDGSLYDFGGHIPMLYEELKAEGISVPEHYLLNVTEEAKDGISFIHLSFPCCKVFSTSVRGFIDLMASLEGVEVPHLSGQWLAEKMKKIDSTGLEDSWNYNYEKLIYQVDDDQNISEVFSIDSITYIFQVLKNKDPNTTRDQQLGEYLRRTTEVKKMIEFNDEYDFDEAVDREALIYGSLFMELTTIQQMVSAELLKSYLFILAHESWHLWFGLDAQTPAEFKKEEFKADAHGIRVYLDTYKEIDFEKWSAHIDRGLGLISTQNDSTGKAFFEQFSGRNPDVIIYETFKDTRFYKGAFYHPPMSERLARIKEQVTNSRLEYTDKIIEELACSFEQTTTQLNGSKSKTNQCN